MPNQSFQKAVEDIAKSMWVLDEAKAQLAEHAKEFENSGEKAAPAGVHTTNTGFGQELINDVTYKDELYSMVAEENPLLPLLPGNYGQLDSNSVKVAIKGKPQLFKKGSERVGSDGTNVTGSNSVVTDQIQLTMVKYETQIWISREAAKRSVLAGGLLNFVRNQVIAGGSETLTAAIINADTQSNITTGNVNKKTNGANPVALDTTSYFLAQDNGLRKIGIANAVVAAAAISRSQYQAALLKLGDYSDDEKNLLWLASADAGTRARLVDGYETMEKYGQNASNVKGGIMNKIEGIDVFKTRHLSSAVNADGYIETGDSAANIKSQLQLIYKPAIQYAFGDDMVIIPIERAGGWMLDVAMWFGFAIANEDAGLDKTVATIIINKS